MISIQELNRRIGYDPLTGLIKWKIPTHKNCTKGWFKGHISAGYYKVTIHGTEYSVSNIAWALSFGYWCEGGVVDHKDGNTENNRLSNLRLTTTHGNMRNRKLPTNNSSGVHGVYFVKRTNKYKAGIVVDSKYIHLGYFTTLDDAAVARREAESKYGFHINHGRD